MNSYLINQARIISQDALRALKRGDKGSARRLAEDAILLAPELEQPWLILAAFSSPEDSLAYVQKALQINPDSTAAKKALEWANTRLQKKPLSAGSDDQETEEPVETDEPQLDKLLFEPVATLPGQVEQPLSLEDSPGFQTQASLTDSRSAKKQRISRLTPALIFLFSALGLLAVALLAGLTLLRPQITSLLAGFFPGEGCKASLVLGTRSFQIRTLKPESDGSLQVPGNQPERAYWVDGTNTNSVFLLSPVPENLSLVTALQAGEPATVTRANCNTTTYSLSLAVPGSLDMPALLDQSSTHITIIVPTDGTLSGFVLHGELQQ